jgi:hypothetical protein
LCLNCNNPILKISKQWKNQLFCSTRCRKESFRRKKSTAASIKKREANLLLNDEMAYLIRQCRYAGTVQILSGQDFNSFVATMKLIRERPVGHVHLCHIAPVKNRDFIGLLHYRNLFYGGDYQNKLFGNSYLGDGLYILKSMLEKRWCISADESNQDVMTKIRAFLGGIFERYIRECSVRKSKKLQIINKILRYSNFFHVDELMGMSRTQLSGALSKIIRQPVFTPNKHTESKFITYLDGLTRFIEDNHKRAKIFKKLRSIIAIAYLALERVEASDTFNKDFYVKYHHLIKVKHREAMLKHPNLWSHFKDLLYETAFKTLSGRKLNTKRFRKEVMSYLNFPDVAWRVRLAPWQYRMRYDEALVGCT